MKYFGYSILLIILISFHLTTLVVSEWNQFSFQGDAPKSRFGHCMITIQSKLYNNVNQQSLLKSSAISSSSNNVKLQIVNSKQEQIEYNSDDNYNVHSKSDIDFQRSINKKKNLILRETPTPTESILSNNNNSYWIYGGRYSFSSNLVTTPLLLLKDLTGKFAEQSFSLGLNPGSRWGHACHTVGFYDNATEILVFGGSTDVNDLEVSGQLWKYSILLNSWKLLTDYQAPISNSTSSSSSSSGNDTLVVDSLSSLSSYSDDGTSNISKIVMATVTPVIPNELFPYPRTMFGSCTNGTFLFIFGGYVNKSGVMVAEDDFWMYNMINQTWIQFKPQDDGFNWPSARLGHSMVFAQKALYLFGGLEISENYNSASDQLWKFSLVTLEWTLLFDESPSPSARAYHTMVVDSKKETAFFIYGGIDRYQLTQSDLWIYDLDSEEWDNIETSFESPELSHSAMTLSSDVNGFLMYGGTGSDPSSFLSYGLDCNCNSRGGCFYGICSCFSGYFGEYCQNSIDGPILLGLGLAISVPILCFGWCVLRCTTLPTRMKILTLIIIVMSCSLFASVESCLECWLPEALMGLITGSIGLLGILKYKNPKIILYFTISVFLTLGVGVYGVVSFLPSCMMGNCRNDKPKEQWLPKYAIIMSFVHLAFLVLVLPLSLKLYKHRRYINTISNNPAIASSSSGLLFSNNGLPQQPLNPLLKKIQENEQKEKNPNNNNSDSNGSNDTYTSEQNQKALNYLQKEYNLRSDLNKIRVSKNTAEELRIKVDREHILEDTYRQLSQVPTQQLVQNISIKFIGEEGVDMGGLKKEWFSLVFKQLFDPLYGLFVLNTNYSLSISPTSHLQPDHLAYFLFGGKMVARSVIEGVHLDHTFSRTIYKLILGKPPCLDDLIYVDPAFHKSLLWILENSVDEMEEVTFSTTVDQIGVGHVLVDLKPNGRDILVNEDNKQEFVDLMTLWRFQRDISDQAYHFIQGFREIIPLELISNFTECELELFICGLVEIDIGDWKANTTYRGYTATSSVIEWFWEVVEEMEIEDRIRLLQFVTGNARLPPSGFQGLHSAEGSVKFQIHKSFTPDNQLPVARTCFNRLDLPNYDCKERLKYYLILALKEGLPGFGLA
ncbi:putative E3 ubiquitin-protein ligase [Tieghemostelium lacteum]|uniref:HECT-type E3 ubiquitin transferase n=1 Tax=Tieghemostelium lacteum TaxID=361077 RepID=A0A151ZGK4_TIELA|nr:putative E3 ubiquitin-protein ligase [Tieghemostelium lacteum]|eukprot:KYQ92994.1 putative E3 ubiquitin-protein ligase [Tieghemostelium lacteum]